MENREKLQFQITKILLSLGFSINLKGFEFYRDCIERVVRDPLAIGNATKKLYPEVGREHNVSGAIVERSMRRACDLAYRKTKFKTSNEFFKMADFYQLNYKPTSSELIALISEYIRSSSQGQ